MTDRLTGLVDVLTGPYALAGLTTGLAGLLAIIATDRRRRSVLPYGLVIAVAAGAGAGYAGEVAFPWAGLGVAAVGGLLLSRWKPAWVLVVTGATLTGGHLAQIPTTAAWLSWSAVILVPLLGWLLVWLDSAPGTRRDAPLMIAIAVAGLWLAVPDTELSTTLLLTTAVITLTVWPSRQADLGFAGGFAVVIAVMWAAVNGSPGRPEAAIGAIATLAVAVAPVAAGAGVIPGRDPHRFWLVATHTVAVIAVTRVAPTFGSITPALVMIIVVIAGVSTLSHRLTSAPSG